MTAPQIKLNVPTSAKMPNSCKHGFLKVSCTPCQGLFEISKVVYGCDKSKTDGWENKVDGIHVNLWIETPYPDKAAAIVVVIVVVGNEVGVAAPATTEATSPTTATAVAHPIRAPSLPWPATTAPSSRASALQTPTTAPSSRAPALQTPTTAPPPTTPVKPIDKNGFDFKVYVKRNKQWQIKQEETQKLMLRKLQVCRRFYKS